MGVGIVGVVTSLPLRIPVIRIAGWNAVISTIRLLGITIVSGRDIIAVLIDIDDSVHGLAQHQLPSFQ